MDQKEVRGREVQVRRDIRFTQRPKTQARICRVSQKAARRNSQRARSKATKRGEVMIKISEKELTRRGFITRVGQGLVVANVAAPLLKDAHAQLRVPDPPGKKLGWAIVGLGSLSINQILPAFAKCEKSKVVAFVSGHPDKANKLALRYGVNPKNIYNYQNYDTIRDNPEVDVIYIVLPNGMHAEYTIRGHQAGKHVLTEKPMANTPEDCQAMVDAGH